MGTHCGETAKRSLDSDAPWIDEAPLAHLLVRKLIGRERRVMASGDSPGAPSASTNRSWTSYNGDIDAISFLNSRYEIYAGTLQKRLAVGIDKELMNTQYGFRAKRSTAQAIHIARRAREYAEQNGSSLTMVLLG